MEYNEEIDSEFRNHITEGIEQKSKKNHSNMMEKAIYQLISSIIDDNKTLVEKIIK